jgi:predicted MFS family arabinose efflux permease
MNMINRYRPLLALYGAALLQGLVLVSFPASSAVLRHMHGFSEAQYGAIFLPQVLLAVVGALAGSALAGRLSLKKLLLVSLAANALSQMALFASPELTTSAYICILFATGCLGFGFGLSGAPLNSLPGLLFPARRDTALVAVHSSMGAGLMLGPLLVGWMAAAGLWRAFPSGLVLLLLVLCWIISGTTLPDERRHDDNPPPPLAQLLVSVWPLLLIAVLYALSEGIFSNWAVIYLHEGRAVPEMTATLALSAFWGALVAGRLLATLLLLKLRAQLLWLALPPLMLAAFWLLPYVNSGNSGVMLYALGGLACSAFFPLTVAIAVRIHPRQAAALSSLLTAALMLGVGAGSFLIGLLKQSLDWNSLYHMAALFPLLAFVLAVFVVFHERGKL